jgi:hypothetical protein
VTFTPFRLSRGGDGSAAKVAIPAKAGHTVPVAFAAFATFAGAPLVDTDSETLAERAAIIEEGANVPREWAEGFARLEAMRAPAGTAPATWLAIVTAAGRFIDKWGAHAAALGWTVGELFGLDPNASLNRRGAAFLLADGEVAAVTAEAITLHRGGDVLRVYRRVRQNTPAWEALSASGI